MDNMTPVANRSQFHDPGDALEGSSGDASDPGASDDDFGFVLSVRPNANAKFRHPPPELIHRLWQIFVENIDPLTKVVHVPTLRPAIQKAASDTDKIPRSFEALIFAIYSTAIMSLSDDECKQSFDDHRGALLSRYISATKAALSRAKFMETTNFVVLQALVLHILSVRTINEPLAVWSLTGVAIRIAQSMGFERDGEVLGVPPFEAEMRRRVWWVLKNHDFRTAELCGLPKLRDLDMGAESMKGPTNVNDDQLYPGMPSLTAETNKVTDAVFVAPLYEFQSFAGRCIARFRQQGKTPSQWELHGLRSHKAEEDPAIKEIEELIETKYLRYCDPSQPLHLLTMLQLRVALNVIRFLANHPRRWASLEQTPLSERHRIWDVSVKILEQQNMMQSNSQLKQFAWQASYFLQWQVFIHVLDTLKTDPLKADADKAWKLIGNTYENNPITLFDTKKPVHVAVGNLCLKAYSAREVASRNEAIYLPPTPEFIFQLRQQRQVAKAKKGARDATSSQAVSQSREIARDISSRSQASANYTVDTERPLPIQHISTSPPPPYTGATEGDSFWSLNGLDDSQASSLNDMMNLDTDFMLAQDYNMDGNTAQPNTWEQWDTWLGLPARI